MSKKLPSRKMYITDSTACDYCDKRAEYWGTTLGGRWSHMCPEHYQLRATKMAHASAYNLVRKDEVYHGGE